MNHERENAHMFITYGVAIDLIRNLRDVVPAIKRHDRDLADQIQRAASSVALNLSEGQRRTAGNQRNHYETAHGSANEVKGALDLAEAWGWLGDTEVPRKTLDRLLGLLWGLTHPHKRSPAGAD
jgi:four helix bundle protein